MTQHSPLLLKAVELAGTQQKLADKIGVSQQLISYLINHADRVPAEIAVKIDSFTNGAVSKASLRPDLFEVPA